MPQPESWMIIGQPWTGSDGGVVLLATDRINGTVNLHQEATYRTGIHISLRTELGGYLLVYGETYADALRKLFRQWEPGDAVHRLAIEQGRI